MNTVSLWLASFLKWFFLVFVDKLEQAGVDCNPIIRERMIHWRFTFWNAGILERRD